MQSTNWLSALFFVLKLLVSVVLISGERAPAASGEVRFSETLIADKYQYPYGVVAADLDGDGDLDLTSQDIIGSTPNRDEPTFSSLYWFQNDGKGSFTKHVIHQGEPGWFERHAVGDIDGDGRSDIVIVNNRDGHLIWFANPDPPTGLWKRCVISTKCSRAYDVVLADFDGDNDPDAAASGYISGEMTWYSNPGKAHGDQEWTKHLIDDKMPEARTIGVGDFNRDGKPDLLGASVGIANVPADVTDVKQHGASIVWYENSGQPGPQLWKKHIIDDRSRAPIHGHSFDLDGDGDLDVVMALGMREELTPEKTHHVAWYENVGTPGLGHSWRKLHIGDLPYAFEAVPEDIDGDGDIDVAATAWAKGDKLVWFENERNPQAKWTLHTIKENWKSANQLIVVDIDGDKRLDIAATADNGSSRIRYQGAKDVRWWRNLGARK
jgi:hypothetical protein